MPSNFAHYRFGKLAFPSLPPEARGCIQRFRRLYDMGQQGPDFFFYCNPLWETASVRLGHSYHQQTGQEFFTKAWNLASTEAAKAYLYGVLGHYCLDSSCHPYVNKVVDAGEANHIALESEFDRYLMAMDGIQDPATYDMSDKIRLTRGECVTVAFLYPPATPGSVHRGVAIMRMAIHYLAGKNQERVKKQLNLVKPSLQTKLVPSQPIAEYARMDSELLARFNRALRAYPQMVQQLLDLAGEEGALDESFAGTFG